MLNKNLIMSKSKGSELKKIETQLKPIKLVGIQSRTNNALEMNESDRKIPGTIQKYFQNRLYEKISNRKKPGVTYCVYTDYESDFNGDYTFFIGEEIDFSSDVNLDFKTLTIPTQTYVKFTNGPGQMPEVCVNAWKKIWDMSVSDFGGKRVYVADFEIYDERSQDPKNTILDIYVGIKK